MISQKEGPAIRQDTRANQKPALSRKPIQSVADQRDYGDFKSRGEFIATVVVGALFLYAFMWLAAAY